MELKCGTVDHCLSYYFNNWNIYVNFYWLVTCTSQNVFDTPGFGNAVSLSPCRCPKGATWHLLHIPRTRSETMKLKEEPCRRGGAFCSLMHRPDEFANFKRSSFPWYWVSHVPSFFFFVIFEDEMNSLHCHNIVILLLFALKAFYFVS